MVVSRGNSGGEGCMRGLRKQKRLLKIKEGEVLREGTREMVSGEGE